MIKVISENGVGHSTQFLDAKTGENISKSLAIKYGATIKIDHVVSMEAELEVVRLDVDIDNVKWMTRNPVTNKLQPLASMTFADGVEVHFREDGAPYIIKPHANQ